MRIAIDAHSVGARLGGNETYAINLIEALAEIDRAFPPPGRKEPLAMI